MFRRSSRLATFSRKAAISRWAASSRACLACSSSRPAFCQSSAARTDMAAAEPTAQAMAAECAMSSGTAKPASQAGRGYCGGQAASSQNAPPQTAATAMHRASLEGLDADLSAMTVGLVSWGVLFSALSGILCFLLLAYLAQSAAAVESAEATAAAAAASCSHGRMLSTIANLLATPVLIYVTVVNIHRARAARNHSKEG